MRTMSSKKTHQHGGTITTSGLSGSESIVLTGVFRPIGLGSTAGFSLSSTTASANATVTDTANIYGQTGTNGATGTSGAGGIGANIATYSITPAAMT
jgi:hypothetical protein